MTEEKNIKIETTPGSWKPNEEMVTRTITALKNTPDNLWEEFKAVEVKVGNLQNETGEKVHSIIWKANSDLNTSKCTKLLFHLRGIVREEAGL